jgi:hypothetical protein
VSCNRLVGCSGRQRLTGSGPVGGAAASEPTTKLRDGSPSLGSRAARFAAGVQKRIGFQRSRWPWSMIILEGGAQCGMVRGAADTPGLAVVHRLQHGNARLQACFQPSGTGAARRQRRAGMRRFVQVWARGAAQAGGVFVVQRVRKKSLSPCNLINTNNIQGSWEGPS